MQVWPQSAWFGLTHRRLRMFQFCILFLLAGVLLLLLLTIGYARYRAHVAKQLSVRVQALTIGKPPPPEVIAQLKQHQTKIHFGEEKPCTPQDCVYVAAISTFGLSNFEGYGVLPQEFAWSVLGALDNETLRYMGIRHWIVGASVGVADGRVAWYSGDVFVEGPQHKWLDTSWHVAPAMPERVVRVYESTSMDLSSCAYLVDCLIMVNQDECLKPSLYKNSSSPRLYGGSK